MNTLWIPQDIYNLVLEECVLQDITPITINKVTFLNSFSWSSSRQWIEAWDLCYNNDHYELQRWIKENNWRKINDNDFYVKMMKD